MITQRGNVTARAAYAHARAEFAEKPHRRNFRAKSSRNMASPTNHNQWVSSVCMCELMLFNLLPELARVDGGWCVL